jgi:hypothetical protein
MIPDKENEFLPSVIESFPLCLKRKVKSTTYGNMNKMLHFKKKIAPYPFFMFSAYIGEVLKMYVVPQILPFLIDRIIQALETFHSGNFIQNKLC